MKTKRNNRQGYTLVEIMFASTISVMLMAMALPFMIESYKKMFIAENKNLINSDIRSLTNEMMNNARMATTFIVYDSYMDSTSFKDRKADGQSGDMLVLVTYDDTISPLDTPRIERIVAYYRAPEDPGDLDSLGPVRRYVATYAPSQEVSISTEDYSYTTYDSLGNQQTVDTEIQAYNIESFLPALSEMNTHPEVVELSQGLSNGHLFTIFWNRSIIVNGRIYHGNDAKRVTDTYNFTISPRG